MKSRVSQWGSWDIQAINGVLNLQHMTELKIGIYDDFHKTYVQNMHPHKHVKRYGLHAIDGSYMQIAYQVGNFAFSVEFAAHKDKFVLKLIPQKSCQDFYYYISGHLMWNASGFIEKESDSLRLCANGTTFHVCTDGFVENTPKYYFASPGLLISAKEVVYLYCNMSVDREAADRLLAAKLANASAHLADRDPRQEKAVDAIGKVMTWNTVYDPGKDRMLTPVTRLWCLSDGAEFGVFGCYVQFCWDTFFNGLLASELDKEFAYQQIRNILSEATDRGMIPNTNAHRKKSLDRSQPPVGSFCVWKLYEKFSEPEFLEETFDKLYAWNRYWFRFRDRNNDGLLEWGSDPYPEGYRSAESAKLNYSHTLAAAKLESGLDNSPMYDEASFDETLCTLNLNDVGLNALYTLDLLCLSKMAGILGRDRLQAELVEEYEIMRSRVNERLWNEELGIYCNRFWDGSFSETLSPTNFYPLLAQIPDEKQIERMVREHLLNPNEFWGEFVLPSVSKNHAAFADDRYWRGRIWAPMNYLVFEGLRAAGRVREAEELAGKGYEMFSKVWEQEQIVSENYHADGTAADDPFYTWGALLAYCYLRVKN